MRGPGRFLALAAIRGYQRWLSPRKGFCCAFRAATGGESCSSYGYRVIERFGLGRGLGLLDRRLALCGHVHRRTRPAPASRPPMMRYRQLGLCDGLDCDCADLGNCAGELGSCGCDAGDCRRSRKDKPVRQSSAQMDAIAKRVREQRERKRRADPDTR